MPELPDVEILRRRFVNGALKRRIEGVDVQTPRLLAGISPRKLDERLTGERFSAAHRYGKRLYCALEHGGWVSLHFGLTGDLQLFRDSDAPPHFARVVIDFSDGQHLAYTNRRMIGRIEWVEDLAADIRAKHLGPDALDPKFTLAAFKRALSGRRGSLKSLLMDQSVMAGVGNAYSDEILFQCRWHPLRSVETLDDAERGLLYRTMRNVLKRAIACDAAPEKFPRSFLMPNRRAGASCPRCGGEIRRIEVDGRGSYFCPVCQAPEADARMDTKRKRISRRGDTDRLRTARRFVKEDIRDENRASRTAPRKRPA